MIKKKELLLSTSRKPTRRMRTFCHDLARGIPLTIQVNRGKLSIDGIAEKALECNADRVVIVSRWKGRLGKIELYKIGAAGLAPFPPVVYVKNIKLQREFEGKRRGSRIKSLAIILSSEAPSEARKIAKAFSEFFKIPLLSVEQAVTEGYQASMHVSLDSLNRSQLTFLLLPQKVELGPRITISHLLWSCNNEVTCDDSSKLSV